MRVTRRSAARCVIALLCSPISWPERRDPVEGAQDQAEGSVRARPAPVPVAVEHVVGGADSRARPPTRRSGRSSPRRGPCRDAGPGSARASRRAAQGLAGSGRPRRPASAGAARLALGRPARTSASRPARRAWPSQHRVSDVLGVALRQVARPRDRLPHGLRPPRDPPGGAARVSASWRRGASTPSDPRIVSRRTLVSACDRWHRCRAMVGETA